MKGIVPLCAWILAATLTGVAFAAEPKDSPKGFRLKNGTLIIWGIGRDQAQARAGSAIDCNDPDNKYFLTDSKNDCLLVADATPAPYDGGGELMFSRNKFYGVRLTLPSDRFAEAERSISSGLDAQPIQTVGTVQNGFGATFDQVQDVWKTNGTVLSLTKRAGRVDLAVFTMYYLPLVPKRSPKPTSPPF